LKDKLPTLAARLKKHEALLQDGDSSSMKLLGIRSSEMNHEVRKCQKHAMQESYDNISISPPFLQKKTKV